MLKNVWRFFFGAEGYCWSKTSERQVVKIRRTYLEAVLRQEVSFFESQDASISEIFHTISTDTSLIQQLLSEKVSHFDKMCFDLLDGWSAHCTKRTNYKCSSLRLGLIDNTTCIIYFKESKILQKEVFSSK